MCIFFYFFQPRSGSSSGFRHKIETINKLKELFKKEKHPNFGKVGSPETRKPLVMAYKIFIKTMFTLIKV